MDKNNNEIVHHRKDISKNELVQFRPIIDFFSTGPTPNNYKLSM